MRLNPSQKTLQGVVETEKPQNESDKKLNLLLGCAQMFNKETPEELLKPWVEILKPCSLQGLEYAFEYWARNGSHWPYPSDILDVYKVWIDGTKPQKPTFKSCGKCDDEGWVRVTRGWTVHGDLVDEQAGAVHRCECYGEYAKRMKDWVIANPGVQVPVQAKRYPNHGKGYGESDTLILIKLVEQKKRSIGARKFTHKEVDELMDELDRLTGRTAKAG